MFCKTDQKIQYSFSEREKKNKEVFDWIFIKGRVILLPILLRVSGRKTYICRTCQRRGKISLRAGGGGGRGGGQNFCSLHSHFLVPFLKNSGS